MIRAEFPFKQNLVKFVYPVTVRLAESRSNPILFETPVRKRDFAGDLNYLMATEATAKELTISKSTEDLLS